MTVRVSKPEFNLREKISELDKPTGLKGIELMRSETTQEARDLINAGRRNKIINGAMRVAQRGTSESGVTSSGFKQTPDRWRINLSGPTVTVSQSTDSPDGFSHSYKIDVTTADTSITGNDRLILQTRLEGVDLQDFAKGTSSAKDFILSFYCKSTKMGTFTAELEDNDNTGDGGARTVSRHFTISNTEWNRYEINFGADNTGAFDADTGKSMTVFFWLMAGPSYSSGSSLKEHWAPHVDTRRAFGTTNGADSTSNDFYFTGVQLEVGRDGGNATEFEHLGITEDFLLCQRYYFKTTNAKGSVYENGGATTNVGLGVDFPVRMRATPTVTLPTSVSNHVHNYGAGDNSYTGSSGSYGSNVDGANFYMTGGTSRNSGTYSVLNTNAYAEFDAEL